MGITVASDYHAPKHYLHTLFRFKTREQFTQMAQLQDQNPALFALCLHVAALAQIYGWARPTITSVWRDHNDPNGLHEAWQAVDMRISNVQRGDLTTELSLGQWGVLAEEVNETFQYGRLNSRPWKTSKCVHVIEVLDDDGAHLPDTHVHLQERGRRFWH